MENASKALIMAASVLIGIMLLSLMLYMFKTFGQVARNTEHRWDQEEIEAFNSRFLSLDTGGTTYDDEDIITITKVRKTHNGSNELINYKIKDLFKNHTVSNEDDFNNEKRAVINLAQKLNTIYDVVTAINDAIDINDRNNNSYKYGNLEVQNSVEIIVDLGSKEYDFSKEGDDPKNYQYLLIEPNENVKPKCVYGMNSIMQSNSNTNTENKKINVENFKVEEYEKNTINVYDMLKKLRVDKIITLEGKPYLIYQYYFFGQTFTNEETGLIETVKFTLVKDNNFGHWK